MDLNRDPHFPNRHPHVYPANSYHADGDKTVHTEIGWLNRAEGGNLHQAGEWCQDKSRLEAKDQSMFRENKQHLRPYIISNANDLPDINRKSLAKELTPYIKMLWLL